MKLANLAFLKNLIGSEKLQYKLGYIFSPELFSKDNTLNLITYN